MNNNLIIRAFYSEDADAVTAIYRHHVLTGTATFEEQPPKTEEMLGRLSGLTKTGFPVLVATFFFAFQIYGDFSGYSDIAIGLSRLLGFDLMDNFRRPYFAISLTDFWRRWHISLSSWFRDYLYIPLGGNRKGPIRTYQNIFITFVVSGLYCQLGWR